MKLEFQSKGIIFILILTGSTKIGPVCNVGWQNRNWPPEGRPIIGLSALGSFICCGPFCQEKSAGETVYKTEKGEHIDKPVIGMKWWKLGHFSGTQSKKILSLWPKVANIRVEMTIHLLFWHIVCRIFCAHPQKLTAGSVIVRNMELKN